MAGAHPPERGAVVVMFGIQSSSLRALLRRAVGSRVEAGARILHRKCHTLVTIVRSIPQTAAILLGVTAAPIPLPGVRTAAPSVAGVRREPPSSRRRAPCQTSAECDDGLFCNGVERCEGGICTFASSGPCAPGEFCNESTDTCDQCLADADCDDAVACTDNTCVSGSCVFTPNDANCDDALFCNGSEVCDVLLDCQPGVNPCAGGLVCDEVTDACVECLTGADCDDGDPCTDNTCVSLACVFSPAGQVTINMKVEALGNAVTRDTTFMITTCGGSMDTRVVPVAFDGFGTGTAVLSAVDAAAQWIAVSEGHTLRRLAPLVFVSCAAIVDVTGAGLLPAGDFQTATVPQDNLVDITDFSILASRFNSPIDPNLSSGADATGDGLQETADFTAIQVNFLTVGDALDGCAGGLLEDDFLAIRPTEADAVVERGGPRSAIPVSALPIAGVERADVNGDGVIDARDVRAFARRHHLPLQPEFLRRLKPLARERLRRAPQDRRD